MKDVSLLASGRIHINTKVGFILLVIRASLSIDLTLNIFLDT
jgi:hypothetical protein